MHPIKTKAAEIPPIPYAQTAIYKSTYTQEQTALSATLLERGQKLIGRYGGQCVVFARQFAGMGRNQIQGLAKNTKINSQEPSVGAIIVLAMSRYGHVGVTLYTSADRIYYIDSNGNWTQRIAIRSLPLHDPRIKGYLVN